MEPGISARRAPPVPRVREVAGRCSLAGPSSLSALAAAQPMGGETWRVSRQAKIYCAATMETIRQV